MMNEMPNCPDVIFNPEFDVIRDDAPHHHATGRRTRIE
jgi:hypothetical protein